MTPTSSQPSQRRRAILRGSLAAPVVLTVSSPAAATVTTFGKCLANHANEPPPQTFFAATPDNWFRKQVSVVQLKHGNDVDWFYLDPGFNDYVRLSAPGQPSGIGALLQQGWHKVGEGKRWAVVWVDTKSGSPFSVVQVQQPMGYTAATGSCMASVKPGWGKKA